MSVTVVIPTYNRGHLIAHALESIRRQSYPDIDVIVVDDGSTDDTAAVVARFGSSVRYITQANRGCGAARNTGLVAARGRYVAFLDSDDRWMPFKLSVQIALLEAHHDVGLVFSDFFIEKPGGRTVERGASRWAGRPLDFAEMRACALSPKPGGGDGWPAPSIPCFVGPMYRQLLDELPILTSSVVVRRDAIAPFMRYAEQVKLFEDWTFFALVAREHAIGYVDVPAAVNVGHDDPGRVSHCDALTRARAYLSLLDRVWADDPRFVASDGEALRHARGRGLLAVARAALLAGEPAEARAALQQWRTLSLDDRRMWASFCAICAGVPGGRILLRNALRGRAVLAMLSGSRREYTPVNPAA